MLLLCFDDILSMFNRRGSVASSYRQHSVLPCNGLLVSIDHMHSLKGRHWVKMDNEYHLIHIPFECPRYCLRLTAVSMVEVVAEFVFRRWRKWFEDVKHNLFCCKHARGWDGIKDKSQDTRVVTGRHVRAVCRSPEKTDAPILEANKKADCLLIEPLFRSFAQIYFSSSLEKAYSLPR